MIAALTQMTLAKTTLTALAAAFTLSGCQQADDAAFGQRVRKYLLANPEVLQETIDALHRKEQAQMIGRYRAQLERDPRDPVINPNGTVTVVEFFDYRCSYCKLIAPEVVKLIRENPDVRFVFKEYPIFGEVSDTAAKMALTAYGKTKTLDLYQAWMADRGLDERALDRHLAQVGLDPAEVRKAAENPAIERHLVDVQALARAIGLEGTPAFIVGDTLIPGADVNALRAAIVRARSGKRPAGTSAT